MSLSLHIARGNRKTLSRQERTSEATSPKYGVAPALWIFTRTGGRSDPSIKPRWETRHRLPALEKQPITESPTMRSFVFDYITIPVAFKAIRCSRRPQLWNRQARIIMDLTALALRHGWHSLSRV